MVSKRIWIPMYSDIQTHKICIQAFLVPDQLAFRMLNLLTESLSKHVRYRTTGIRIFHSQISFFFREVDSTTDGAVELEAMLVLASKILVISVLTILLTAPLGAVAVVTAGPRLLEARIPDDNKEKVEQA
jgi:hypothetical protein